MQVFAFLGRVARELLVPALEEVEEERGLRARRSLLDLIEELLVAEVALPRGHRAPLDEVIDVGKNAVGGDLAPPQAPERLHLAHEPRRFGQHGMLAAEVP